MSVTDVPRRPLGARVWGQVRHFFGRPGTPQAMWLIAAILILAQIFPAFFEEVRLRVFDFEQRVAPRMQRDQPVVIVAIDEQALEAPRGQWPWPRTLVAALFSRISSAHPAAVAVDIIFAEPDRFSPANYARFIPDLPPGASAELAAMPSNDKYLGAAVSGGPIVLGMGVTTEVDANPGRHFDATPIRSIGGDAKGFLPTYPTLVRSLPEITEGESGRASLVGNPDRDGIVRRVPLFIVAGGNIIAGLSVEALRVALDQRGVTITTSDEGIVSARIGNYVVPMDSEGRAYPYFAPPQSTPILSAAEVLSPNFDPKTLEGHIVMLGITGLGLVDIKQTPLGLMQGIEVQAQLVQCMLTNEVLRRPIALARIEPLLILLAAVAVLFIPYRRAGVAFGLLMLVLALCLGGEFAAFRAAHILADGVFPAVAGLLTFGIMLSANLKAAEIARKTLAQELELEREATARLEGELGAAKAIQMGLLPRPLPRVPETQAVEVHALIETARMVGGDLYDFVMLDPTHLFFAIADVSGKGVDAALFMAMTKMVLGNTTLQFGEAVDRVLDEANNKIAVTAEQTRAEGGRPMFVTVFAAVLNLETGQVSFASAGHDSPYLLRASGVPQRLDTAGGPPLGTIEEFPYPIDTRSLVPGDVLLLYTDGVTEAKDPEGGFYGAARLEQLLSARREPTARGAVEMLREDVRRFVGSAEQADDITLLGVRWIGPASSLPPQA
jgi:serine phosphatase RsbU (regulator of sigma subunit)